MAERATLTELRAAGVATVRTLHDGLPLLDGWRHVGLSANGDPLYERAEEQPGL